MDCLDANTVQDLMSGSLDGPARGVVLGHLDTCADCRELLSVTASDTLKESLPRCHDEMGLAVTTMPSGKDAALLSTQLPDDGEPGVAATMVPQDLLATPVMRPGGVAPTQGKRVGRFTMVERIGAGAMGIVWRAEDPNLGRSVALKLLRQHDDVLTERLVREAQAMAQVNHPNVVTVYEVGVGDDRTTFIAMELVSGESLRAWQTKAQHTIPEIVAAYISAGRGLAAAHAAGIVHRDFKPDNVLVGEDGRIRVTDFGLAAARPNEDGRPAQRTPLDVNLTTSGSVLGTPAYMAPEQFLGGNVDSRTDQFNFCVSLYEALYGARPFAGKSFTELGDSVCEGQIQPALAGTRVSGALRAILLRGLSRKPGDRFPTMNDLIVELGRDRARPWRRIAIVAAALAGTLGLGLVADGLVRDRVSGEIRQSFALTGRQLQRAFGQLRDQFDTVSQVAYREAALRDLAGHHDQADFGLGSPEDDRAELERLHSTLASTDWVRVGDSVLAIADYKGRLLYTSAAPEEWGTDLKTLPFVKRALDTGKGDSVTVLPYVESVFAATRIMGREPREGLAVVFARTLALGDKAEGQSEARAIYLQIKDGKRLLDNVRLDEQETLFALVAPDGATASDDGMQSELVAAALASVDVSEAETAHGAYLVQARPIAGLDGQGTIAHVVMARPFSGVLSLFPGARTVFVLAALGMLLVAVAAFGRARQITGARI